MMMRVIKHNYNTTINVSTSLTRTKIAKCEDLRGGWFRRFNIHLSSIVTATMLSKITLSTIDEDRRYVLPATTASIDIDSGDATKGTVSLAVDLGHFAFTEDDLLDPNFTGLWIGLQTDAGTLSVDLIEVIVQQ